VVVASGVQHAMRMSHIAICGLSGSTIFLHFISQNALLFKKVIEYEILGFDFFYSFCLKYFSSYEELSKT